MPSILRLTQNAESENQHASMPALLYNAETYGDRAANEIEVARKLIVEIERLMQVQEISPLRSLN
jgi:hypothetical protein